MAKKEEKIEETPVEEVVETVEEAVETHEVNPWEEKYNAEHDAYLRLAADYDNFRKRTVKEKEQSYGNGKADAVAKMLPIYDNLERALKQETADAAYRKGVEMIMTQFNEVLGKMGVTPIETEGQTFDPALHNAVMHCDDPEKNEGEIVQEFQKGFKMGDKVIRFSMVQVAN